MKKNYIIAFVLFIGLCYCLIGDDSIINYWAKKVCTGEHLLPIITNHQTILLFFIIVYVFGIQLFATARKDEGTILLFILDSLLIVGSILYNKNIISKPGKLYYVYFIIITIVLFLAFASMLGVYLAGIWIGEIIAYLILHADRSADNIIIIVAFIVALIIGIVIKLKSIWLYGWVGFFILLSEIMPVMGEFGLSLLEAQEEGQRELDKRQYQDDMYDFHRREADALEKISKKR